MRNTVSLKKNNQFKFVFNRGKWFSGKNIVFYIINNKLTVNRLGIAVGKKVGKSVIRNRIRRVIRESYRLSEENIKKGFDIVILWKGQENQVKYNDLKEEFDYLLRKSNLKKQ